jgi:hypothetical protein
MNVGRAVTLAVAVAVSGWMIDSRSAAAQPPEESDPTPARVPPKREQPSQPQAHDSASVSKAPTPEQASGIARAEPDSAGNNLRVVPRVLLFPVRIVLAVVDAPFRGGFWLYERYQLRDRFKAIFFNDTGTVGLYPVAFVETGFGLNAGARFIHRALYRDASLKARASFGGRFRQIYALKLGSGGILGDRIELELEAEHEIRPKDRFFGIGNSDAVDMVPAPVDPYEDPASVDSRFQQTLSRLSAIANLHVAGPLSARLSSAAMWRDFDDPDPAEALSRQDISQNYDTAELPGFDQGAAYTYHELELRLDTRRSASRYEMITIPSTGWLLSGFGGIARDFGRAPTDYKRYGVDLQRFFRFDEAPRLLALRVYLEGVIGDLDENIPFVDLPRLGGPLLLRGYDQDRFRDRVLGLGSAEYQFDIGYMLTGFLFVDAGRVYPKLDEIELKDMRVGYGGGLQMQTPNSFIGRFSVASSIDGGLLFNFSLDPIYDPKARVERK